MKFDYHMHFEKGDYKVEWAKGFFEAAKKRGLNEIGITEHAHTFPEFEDLYYEDLILDDSFVGSFQKKWLKTNKFKHTIDDYFNFMAKLREYGYEAKIGIEVCNFQNQAKVREILDKYPFDYVIGSIHFIRGWAYDSEEIKAEWQQHSLEDIYEWYTQEIEHLCAGGLYDVLGHPFNIRLYKYFPDFDVTPYLLRAVQALKKADMGIDVNTGTYYRYPVQEISPYGDFLKLAKEYELPIITSSDAHKPEDCGAYIDDAIKYVKEYGYIEGMTFNKRKRTMVPLG
ncbi:MAG: PHP domain-containing protein [Anaerovibrio sp.]|nr:histidinol-phosphatase [Selenomonadaceae bacterium]MDD6397311.1 PHP domain-containing protein [Selenomonadaceae bacterium]MDY6052929.1 PHP domain-containing protein [Anaerovibrio sp.]